jgi:hypothetical protein
MMILVDRCGVDECDTVNRFLLWLEAGRVGRSAGGKWIGSPFCENPA